MITVANAHRTTQHHLRDAQECDSAIATDFAIRGILPQLTDDFFDEDPPIVEADAKEVMCWKIQLHDQAGDLQIQIWDKPCYELFEIAVEKYGVIGRKDMNTMSVVHAS